MTKRAVYLLVALAIAASVGSGASTSNAGTSATRTLTIRLSSSPPNLDPAIFGQEDNPLMMNRFAYDALVVNQDGVIKPYLAKRWEQQSSSRLKFWMRPGVTCADGTKLRPSDVANTIGYFVKPSTASRALTFVFGQATVNVHASDAQGTVTISYPKPFPDALYAIARLPIICRAGTLNPAALKTRPRKRPLRPDGVDPRRPLHLREAEGVHVGSER